MEDLAVVWRILIANLALNEGYSQWVVFCASVAIVLMLFYAHVFAGLSAVRPFLVFVVVNGELPPVCGFCVLFGR